MTFRRSALVTMIGLFLPLVGATRAEAVEPGLCTRTDPISGYCVEWSVGGHDGLPAVPGNIDSVAPICYWATLPPFNDPAIFADFGLPVPPDGAVIEWQGWVCSDGRPAFNLRWVFSVPPEDLALSVRVRIAGLLVAPVVQASPPVGTASIVGIPVFVAVANWTGVITDSACGGGLCVTVTAKPQLTFSTGDPGGKSIDCAAEGSRFDAARSLVSQTSTPGACAYVYHQRTGAAGRPAVWPGSVSVTWSLAWTSTVGQTGVLPSVTRSVALPRAVQEVQTVVVGGSS